jgi:hypothetical protein
VAPEGQEPQGALAEEQQLPQNDENNNNNDNVGNINHDDKNHDNDDENDNKNNDDVNDDEEYTPLIDSENEKMYCDTDELKSFGNEALIPTDRLRDLLGHVGITTAPEFRIKRVMCPG